MTGWHLRPGYSSTTAPHVVWNVLKDLVSQLREQPERIVAETSRGELRTFSPESIQPYADLFRASSPDSTLVLLESAEEFMLLASGGGPGRPLKEATRRAFCRLVLAEMHLRGLDVTLVVA